MGVAYGEHFVLEMKEQSGDPPGVLDFTDPKWTPNRPQKRPVNPRDKSTKMGSKNDPKMDPLIFKTLHTCKRKEHISGTCSEKEREAR